MLQSHGLPTPSHPIAGLSFLPHLPNILVLVCTNSLLQIFDVASRSYAPWAKHLNTEDLDFKEQVIGLAVEPLPAVQGSKEAQLSMMLWGAGFTASFRLPTARALADLTVESGQKRQQRDEKADGEENDDSEAEGKNIEDAPDPTTLSNLRTNFRFEHLIGVAYLNHGELAISERPYVDLLPDLPAAFYKPSYGKA